MKKSNQEKNPQKKQVYVLKFEAQYISGRKETSKSKGGVQKSKAKRQHKVYCCQKMKCKEAI